MSTKAAWTALKWEWGDLENKGKSYSFVGEGGWGSGICVGSQCNHGAVAEGVVSVVCVASAELVRLGESGCQGRRRQNLVGGECTAGRRGSRTYRSVKLAERPDSIELDMMIQSISERGQRRELLRVCESVGSAGEAQEEREERAGGNLGRGSRVVRFDRETEIRNESRINAWLFANDWETSWGGEKAAE